ncbi:hypothetical protein [Nocardioides convexus]|uniref:hypothetical protein n=1 Tax=Nocardioides convexus TaxID=2712224 RepID=UPI00241862C1|nr:hypothetical protein [Nocardioides convexus]
MTATLPAETDTGSGSFLRQPRAVWAVAFACVIAFMGIGLVDPILKEIAAKARGLAQPGLPAVHQPTWPSWASPCW